MMALERSHALHNHLRRWMTKPFQLGIIDCVTFTCEWVDSQLGTAYLERVRRELAYTTQLAALRVISQRGGYESLVTEYTRVEAQREGEFTVGDIALFSNVLGQTTLGILGERLVYAPGEEGLTATDVALADCFWRLEALCHKQ